MRIVVRVHHKAVFRADFGLVYGVGNGSFGVQYLHKDIFDFVGVRVKKQFNMKEVGSVS